MQGFRPSEGDARAAAPAGQGGSAPRTPAEPEDARQGRSATRVLVREHQDRLLDEALEETFPASDPVSVFVVQTGPRS